MTGETSCQTVKLTLSGINGRRVSQSYHTSTRCVCDLFSAVSLQAVSDISERALSDHG
jgi:hypothetical protein